MLPALLTIAALAGGSPATASPAELLHRAIVEHETAEQNPVPGAAEYRVAWADLNGEAPAEALVLLEGPMWCGTGGCTLTVWRQLPDGAFRYVSRSSLCRDEIRLATTTSYGWKDLVVRVTGGGRPGSWHTLQFNGNAYALNPSIEAVFEGDPGELEPLDFPPRD